MLKLSIREGSHHDLDEIRRLSTHNLTQHSTEIYHDNA